MERRVLSPPPLPSPPLPPAAPAPQHAGLMRARAALQGPLLAWWALLTLLPALVATLPVWQLLAASLDHSPQAARLAEGLDLLAIGDLLQAAREQHRGALAAGAGVALALALLLSPLLTGMTAAAARSSERLGFGALLAAGSHEYGRMLRTLVWAAVPLSLALALGGIASNAAAKLAETAVLQADAERAARLALLAAALLVLLAHATLDAGRAVLAAEAGRRSAVLAWCAGCRHLARRPLALLSTYLVVSVAGLALAGAVLLARARLPALGPGASLAGFALTQLAACLLGWMRAARLFAFAALVRAP